jgi:hypothetical protein
MYKKLSTVLRPFTMQWSTQIDFHFFHRSGPLSRTHEVLSIAWHKKHHQKALAETIYAILAERFSRTAQVQSVKNSNKFEAVQLPGRPS